MKKIIISFATICLISSSFCNVVAWTKQQPNQAQPTTKKHVSAKNEDAEDIASKLWKKTIKLDPKFWFNKDIQKYKSQLNAQIIKQGILTKDEVQYVSWSSFKITSAFYYWNKGAFTVTKDEATVTGSVTLNASTGETTTQIAAKLTKANLQFNYSYWDNKTVSDNLTLVRSILVNENILNKYEASDLIGFAKPVKITKAGKIPVSCNVDDNNTQTYAKTNLNVVNDGGDVDTIAQNIEGYVAILKANTMGMYADNSNIEKYVTTYIDKIYAGFNIAQFIFPHQLINSSINSLKTKIIKDGQVSKYAVPFYLFSQKKPSDKRLENSTNNDLKLLVNLNTTATKDLYSALQDPYFFDDAVYNVGYFFNLLNNGGWNNTRELIPDTPNVGFNDAQAIENLMAGFGDSSQTPLKRMDQVVQNSKSFSFYEALLGAITNPVSNPTIMLDIHYQSAGDYYVQSYSFW